MQGQYLHPPDTCAVVIMLKQSEITRMTHQVLVSLDGVLLRLSTEIVRTTSQEEARLLVDVRHLQHNFTQIGLQEKLTSAPSQAPEDIL